VGLGEARIEIRKMRPEDIELMHHEFTKHDIRKSVAYLARCWEENQAGQRVTLAAFYEGSFAGSLHLLDKSDYPYFRENNIPEINDLNVIPPLRKKGIGNALMDEVERLASENYGVVGIGVGLYDSYGSAQRMYARRGYILDGKGVMYEQQPVAPGSTVCVDDDLNLFLTKTKQGGGWRADGGQA
jgi:GNAT superfamily N-acetyltransferase